MSVHWSQLRTFGARLKWARERAGLTQDELAARFGRAARQTVYRWEKDKYEPEFDEVAELAIATKVNRDWLAFGDGDPYVLPSVDLFLRSQDGQKLPVDHAEALRRFSHSLFPNENPTKKQIRMVLSLIAQIMRPARKTSDDDRDESSE